MSKLFLDNWLGSYKSTVLSIFLIVGPLPYNTAKAVEEPDTRGQALVSDVEDPDTRGQALVSDVDKFTFNFFNKTKQYTDLVKQNSSKSSTSLYLDLNSAEYSMEGKGDETGLEIDIDGFSYTVSKGTKKMTSRVNYRLIGNVRTFINEGFVTALTTTSGKHKSLGIKKKFTSGQLHSSSIGVNFTEEKGHSEVASKIDLSLLTSNTSQRTNIHHYTLSVVQEMSVNIAPAIYFELGFERTKTLRNKAFSTSSASSFFGVKIKPFSSQNHYSKPHLIPNRKYMFSFDFGEANAVPSGVFQNTPGDYDAVTKYRGTIPMKSTSQQITFHNQINPNSSIRFSAQRKKTSGTLKSNKVALSFLSGNAFQLEAGVNMNETRAGLEYERILTKSHAVESFGFLGVFVGSVDFELTEKETLPNSTSYSVTTSNSPIAGASLGFGQRFWTGEKTFFAFENKFNLYDGAPFDVSHQINEFLSEIKIGVAF